ncbi:MAG: energy-coupling factor ABC transporter permease [Clostridia bacterium]|nr:energy-coupling factor ABC transporter permease [Clostridia bacterium]
MSHIHIPDGVLHPVLWVSSYLLAIVIIFVLSRKMNMDEARKKVPLAGIMAAIMLITMAIPLGFIPLHFSLAVLCGILLGPGLGFMVAFVVNMILAFFGHGGITVVGLNTLLMGTEVLIGAYLFRILLKNLAIVPRVIIATVIALLISVGLMVAVVSATVGVAEALPHPECSYDHHDHDGYHGHHDHHDHHDNYASEANTHIDTDGAGDAETVQTLAEKTAEIHFLNITGWSAVFAILLAGIMLETLVTTLIVRYFAAVRPDMIFDTEISQISN